jgi:3-phosphoglycerate kinase
MNLPKLQDLSIAGRKVILRADLDVELGSKGEEFRLKALIPTLKYLADNKAKTLIIGHKGRPQGKVDEELSLKPVAEKLGQISDYQINFFGGLVGEVEIELKKLSEGGFLCLENLRFDAREEENDQGYAKELAALADLYVNEAFATHFPHASIVSLPKLLSHAAGFRFIQEVEKLTAVVDDVVRPLIVVIGGVKKDKTEYIDTLKKLTDKILVGGRLPEFLGDNTVSIRSLDESEKVVIANLMMDKEDITIHSMERFEEEIAKAKTIILAGPMGKCEEEGHRQGTERVFEAVANSSAEKIAGGGDTVAAIYLLGLEDKFNWISVGGGAMLEFLAKGTLPSIEALID